MKLIRAGLLMAVTVLLFSCGGNTEDVLRQTIQLQQDSIQSLKASIDIYKQQMAAETNKVNYWFSNFETGKLKRKGLSDPLNQITSSLSSQTGLIPYKTELGGVMRFWNTTLLRDRWVISEFTDGHVTGTMLLRYEVQEDNTISWQLIDSYLD